MRLTARSSVVVFAVGLTSIAAACGSDNLVTNSTTDGTATLRVINASPVQFSVLVDNAMQVSSVQIANFSPSIAIPAGSHQIKLNGTDGSSSTITINAKSGAVVTAFGARANTSGIAASVLTDTGSIVPVGKSKLRVVHLSANAGNIEIWRTQPDFQTPVHIMTPFAYQAESPYLQSDPGVWEVFVTAAGSTVKLVSTGAISIPSGERRTAVLLDSVGSKVFRVLPE